MKTLSRLGQLLRMPAVVGVAIISAVATITGVLINVYGPRLLPEELPPGALTLPADIYGSWQLGGNKQIRLVKGTAYWFTGERSGDECHVVLARQGSEKDNGPWVSCEDIGEPLLPEAQATGPVEVSLTDLSPRAGWESFQLMANGNSGQRREVLPWMGSRDDERGAARLDLVTLEDGHDASALLTRPQWVSGGTIKGWHPWVSLHLHEKAFFEAQVGFLEGSERSDGVTFMVWEHHYENGLKVGRRLAAVEKAYTGSLETIRVDLSELAGKYVSIELRVDAGRSADDDWAVWVEPRITSTVR